jgi:hypothetical protein
MCLLGALLSARWQSRQGEIKTSIFSGRAKVCLRKDERIGRRLVLVAIKKGSRKMPAEKTKQSYLELYDVEKKQKVAEAPLADIKFIPRTGERIFIPLKGHWDCYTVAAVEYFLGETPTGEPSLTFGRITLYVEESK